MGLPLSGSTALLVSRVLGSMNVCLVSPAMVESTAGIAVVRLLSYSSGCAPAVSDLPNVSPIVDPATYPAAVVDTNYAFRLPFRLLSTVTFPTVRVLAANQSELHVYLIRWRVPVISRTRPVVLSTTEPTARTFRYPGPLSTVTLSTQRPSDPVTLCAAFYTTLLHCVKASHSSVSIFSLIGVLPLSVTIPDAGFLAADA